MKLKDVYISVGLFLISLSLYFSDMRSIISMDEVAAELYLSISFYFRVYFILLRSMVLNLQIVPFIGGVYFLVKGLRQK